MFKHTINGTEFSYYGDGTLIVIGDTRSLKYVWRFANNHLQFANFPRKNNDWTDCPEDVQQAYAKYLSDFIVKEPGDG